MNTYREPHGWIFYRSGTHYKVAPEWVQRAGPFHDWSVGKSIKPIGFFFLKLAKPKNYSRFY
jgi:hypothetical protein